jgi:preprotein translocase subunit Sec61beta
VAAGLIYLDEENNMKRTPNSIVLASLLSLGVFMACKVVGILNAAILPAAQMSRKISNKHLKDEHGGLFHQWHLLSIFIERP